MNSVIERILSLLPGGRDVFWAMVGALSLAFLTRQDPPPAIEHTAAGVLAATIELHDFRENRRSIEPKTWVCEPKPGTAPAWKIKKKPE